MRRQTDSGHVPVTVTDEFHATFHLRYWQPDPLWIRLKLSTGTHTVWKLRRSLRIQKSYIQPSGRSRIVLRLVFLPKNLTTFYLFLSRHTLNAHIRRFDSTPLKLSLLSQPTFSCHPRRFTSPNSALSLQDLLQKISLSLRGEGFVRTQRTP